MTTSELEQDLRTTPGVEDFAETHISWVRMEAREVFKVKKPVSLGFLDYSTLGLRREACEAEVAVNAALAPGVYRGVVPIVRGPDGRHRIVRDTTRPDAPIVEWAVRMVRLPDDRRADRLLASGELSPDRISQLAEKLAQFHAQCRADEVTASYGHPQLIARHVAENFAVLRRAAGSDVLPVAVGLSDEAVRFQIEFVEHGTELFRRRAQKGRVREGHGDLRLEHVYFLDEGRIVVIDAIEFDAAYRVGDVCGDLAFLAMDLAYHARPDLAEHLLAHYARAANDYDLYDLVDFYEAYRACVRAKLAVFGGAGHDARRYYLLAAAAPRRRVVSPSLVVVAGVMASGKTTIAGALAGVLGAPIVDADRTRKHLLGVGSTEELHEPAWSGAYDPSFTERVYAEVFRRAEVVLRSGRPVIIDASFRSRALRQRARDLAAACEVPFQLVECRAPDDVCRARLGARAGAPGIVSDGRIELFDEFKRSFETINELSPSEHVVVDTTQPLADTTEDVRKRVPSWPPGLLV